jgi:hypothetical protein
VLGGFTGRTESANFFRFPRFSRTMMHFAD